MRILRTIRSRIDQRDLLSSRGYAPLVLGGPVIGDAPVVQRFKQRLDCDVVGPGDPDYERCCALFNARIRKRPGVIVYCETAADVATTLGLARELLPHVSIRSGGCSFTGFSSNDGGVLLDVSKMKAIDVDATARRLTVGAGVTMGELYAATVPQGLVMPGGECPMVGVGGLTQGGGFSILSRSLGLTCDSVVGAEIVTADGQVRSLGADRDAALYWAIRGGGGGNFGVVTSFTYRLHTLPPRLWGGLVAWPLDDAREAFLRLQEYCVDEAPDGLGVIFAFLSASAQERLFVAVTVYNGPVEQGKAAVAPLTSIASPVKVAMQEWSFTDFLDQHFPEPPQRMFELAKSGFFRGPLPAEALDTMMDAFADSPALQTMLSFELCGGAINRVPQEATAFFHRDDFLLFGAFADSDRSKGLDKIRDWADGLYGRLVPYFSGHHYRNYPDLALVDWQHGYYGSHYARLAEIKARHDPDNLFRFEQAVVQP